MLSHQMIRGARSLAERLRAELALRGVAKCEGEIRLIGKPLITSAGKIVFGARVALLSEPTPVRLTVGGSGTLELGEGVVVGSGTTIVVHHGVRVGAGVEIGPSCIVSDARCNESDAGPGVIEIGAGARLGAGVTLLHGAVVPAGARVARGAIIRAGIAQTAETPFPKRSFDDGGELLERVRRVVSGVVTSAGDLEADEDLRLSGGWNSLSAIHVLVALESEFGVVLPSSLFERAKTVEDIGLAVSACLRSVTSPPSGVRAHVGG